MSFADVWTVRTRKTPGNAVAKSKNPQRYSLRRIARDIGVEPSFLSKVERDLCTPPSEVKVRQLARLLDEDEDYLVALSGRLGKELVTRIRSILSRFTRWSKLWSFTILTRTPATKYFSKPRFGGRKTAGRKSYRQHIRINDQPTVEVDWLRVCMWR